MIYSIALRTLNYEVDGKTSQLLHSMAETLVILEDFLGESKEVNVNIGEFLMDNRKRPMWHDIEEQELPTVYRKLGEATCAPCDIEQAAE